MPQTLAQRAWIQERQTSSSLFDEDAAIAEENATAEADIVHGFDSPRSVVVPWLRWQASRRGLKKDEMHAYFAVPKTSESKSELFSMLEVMDEVFTKANS